MPVCDARAMTLDENEHVEDEHKDAVGLASTLTSTFPGLNADLQQTWQLTKDNLERRFSTVSDYLCVLTHTSLAGVPFGTT